MTEREYIDTSDLARIRTMKAILRQSSTCEYEKRVLMALVEWEAELELKVVTDGK